jgi:hypothetical protein
MDNGDPQPVSPQQAAGTPAIGRQIKLPSFWPEDPTSWFRLAEGQFTLRNFNFVDPMTHYYHVLVALSVDSVRLVWQVLHEETGPESYDWLSLLSWSHILFPTIRRWRG